MIQEPLGNIDTNIAKEDYTRTIRQFLSRPTLTDSITFGPTSIPVGVLPGVEFDNLSLNFPADAIKVGNRPDKLRNFKYLKCDIHVKVVVNASRYASGRLMMVYSPLDEMLATEFKLQNRLTNLTRISTYPLVEIDLQGDTTMEMIIPFVSFKEAYDLTTLTPEQDYAKWMIFPITPIRTSGSDVVNVAVYTWLENVSLVGMTTLDIHDKFLSEVDVAVKKVRAQFQILPSFSDIISRIKGVLTPTPFIKPTATSVSIPMEQIPGYGATHIRGIDNGINLSLSQENQLGNKEMAAYTDLDEMSIPYIASKPAIYNRIVWQTVDTADLLSFKVTPSYEMGKLVSDDGYSLTPVQFLTTMFQAWHGTMCYKITLAKTAFHTGRLRVTYSADEFDNPAPAAASNVYSTILDITNDSEVNIRVPFIGSSVYKSIHDNIGQLSVSVETPLVSPDTVSDNVDVLIWMWMEDAEFAVPINDSQWTFSTVNEFGIQGQTDPYWYTWNSFDPGAYYVQDGSTDNYYVTHSDQFSTTTRIAIYVDDGLKEPFGSVLPPSTKQPFIRYILFKDLHFFQQSAPAIFYFDSADVKDPTKPIDVLQTGIKPDVVTLLEKPDKVEAEMQISLEVDVRSNNFTYNNSREINDNSRSNVCMGERIHNLRDLLKAFRPHLSVLAGNTILPTPTKSSNSYDLLQHVSMCYRYWRGGLRYKLYYNSADEALGATKSTLTNVVYDAVESISPFHITYNNINPVHEITRPYYDLYRRLPVNSTADTAILPYVQAAADMVSFRAVSDDFSFYTFIGPPILQKMAVKKTGIKTIC